MGLCILARARAARTDVEWIDGTAASMGFDGEFGHALMAGNAFQCFETDEVIASSLTAIHRTLVHGGTFAFETRNRARREWEEWHASPGSEFVDHTGRTVHVRHEVSAEHRGLIDIAEITSTADGVCCGWTMASYGSCIPISSTGSWPRPGFEVVGRYGDFIGGLFDVDSPLTGFVYLAR